MTEQLEQLQSDFKAFRSDCIRLRNAYNTFTYLYYDNGTEEVLRETAELFFTDLNEWLHHSIILQIARLTDRAGSQDRECLTVCWLTERLGQFGLLSPEVNDLAAKLQEYSAHGRAPRNKIVAHADVKTIRDNRLIGEHTAEEDEAFFINLNRFTDSVGCALNVGPLDYSTQTGSGDVIDLVRILKAHLASRN